LYHSRDKLPVSEWQGLVKQPFRTKIKCRSSDIRKPGVLPTLTKSNRIEHTYMTVWETSCYQCLLGQMAPQVAIGVSLMSSKQTCLSLLEFLITF